MPRRAKDRKEERRKRGREQGKDSKSAGKKAEEPKKSQKVGDWDGDDYHMGEQDWPPYVLLKGQTYQGRTGKRRAPVRDIRVNQVYLTVPGKVLLTEDTKFHVMAGNKYGIVGCNGLGKSVLMKRLSQREEPFQNIPEYINILHVEQEIDGDERTALEAVLGSNNELAWLFEQDRLFALAEEDDAMYDQMERKSYDLNDIHDRMREIQAYSAEGRAEKILFGLGFNSDEIRSKKTREYSGGWRMRIALACALFGEPDLLILDEPTNHLDIPAVVWLEDYLSHWKKSLLLVSHDRHFLDVVLDRANLRSGNDGGTNHIIHLHKQTLTYFKGNFQSFQNQLEVRRREEANKKKRKGKPKDKKEEESHLRGGVPDERAPTFNFPEPKDMKSDTAVMSVRNVSFGYQEQEPIFEHLDLAIYMDSRIGCVGPNGAGKSTLLKLLDNSLQPTKGFIERKNHLRVVRFHQHHVDQLGDLDLSPVQYFASKYGGQTFVFRQHLARFGVKGNMALQKIASLSGGQKSRVALADLAWGDPHVLLLDEPTNHLDMDTIDSLVEGLEAFEGAVVVISHNQHLIKKATNELWVVSKKGAVKRFNGDFEEYKDEIMARFEDRECIEDCEDSEVEEVVDDDFDYE